MLLENRGSTVTECVAVRTLFDKPQTTQAELVEVLAWKWQTSRDIPGIRRRSRHDH